MILFETYNIIEKYLTLFMFLNGQHCVIFKWYKFRTNIFRHFDVSKKMIYENFRLEIFLLLKKRIFVIFIHISTIEFLPNYSLAMFHFLPCHFVQKSCWTFYFFIEGSYFSVLCVPFPYSYPTESLHIDIRSNSSIFAAQ